MADPTGAVLGKVGVVMLRAVTPGAVAWLKMQVMGKTVLFVGPARGGKTSFINFLRTGSYVDPSDTTPRTTQAVKNTGSLQLKAPNGLLSIDLKKVLDTKGQDFPENHAELVASHRPHALCVVLDAASEWASTNPDPNRNNRLWLEDFLSRLCECREDDPNVFRRLKSFSVLLNKVDLLTSENMISKRPEQIKALVSSHLRGKAGRAAKLINVKPLSLVEDYSQGKLAAKAALSVFIPLVRD